MHGISQHFYSSLPGQVAILHASGQQRRSSTNIALPCLTSRPTGVLLRYMTIIAARTFGQPGPLWPGHLT